MSYIGTTEIGKMFLGNVEIDKAYLGNDLVFSGIVEPEGGALSDYIQDGLILHMDGKSRKSGSTWSSVVGNYSFTNSGATFNADHVYFNGSNNYLTNTTFEMPSDTVGTIEVCFERSGSSSRIVFMPKTAGALAFGFSNALLIWTNNSSKKTRYSNVLNKAIVSVNNDRAIMNGNAMSASSTDYWTGRSSTTSYIGRRSNGSYFYGKIYSIRVYSRKLSLDEIIANQKVDNIRFELGLSL